MLTIYYFFIIMLKNIKESINFRITPIIWFGGLYQEPKFLITKKVQNLYFLC